MVRALLTQRNTPDPGCKLSPAQILFGRPLKDTLPYISKDIMSFNNPQISNQWRDIWKLKEDTMKARYVKTIENLNEHTRQLALLSIGDYVFVQNQHGRFPTKWDKSGVVVQIKDNDQYLIKVAGTGRLTLRNRRFLLPLRTSLSPISSMGTEPTRQTRDYLNPVAIRTHYTVLT